MADTPRLRTALQTIFADNNSQAITAQDVRDFLASVPLTTEASEYGTAATYPASYFATLDSPAFTGIPTGIGIPVYSVLTSDAVTSSATYVVVAGSTGPSLSIPVVIGTYEFVVNLIAASSEATNGCSYTIGGVGGTGTIEGEVLGCQDDSYLTSVRIDAFNEDTGAWIKDGNVVLMRGTVTITTNTTLSVKHLKIIGGTSTVYTNSFLKVTRIS